MGGGGGGGGGMFVKKIILCSRVHLLCEGGGGVKVVDPASFPTLAVVFILHSYTANSIKLTPIIVIFELHV